MEKVQELTEHQKEMTKFCLEMAVDELVNTGGIEPKFILIRDGFPAGFVFAEFSSPEAKRRSGIAAAAAAVQLQAESIITITECWMVIKNITDPGEKLGGVPPSEHPDRQEAIAITLITPDGLTTAYNAVYKREENGSITLEPSEFMTGGSQSIVPPWKDIDGRSLLSNRVRKPPPFTGSN